MYQSACVMWVPPVQLYACTTNERGTVQYNLLLHARAVRVCGVDSLRLPLCSCSACAILETRMRRRCADCAEADRCPRAYVVLV